MTAATTAVAVSQAAVFGAIGVIVLIGLLMANDLLSASGSEKAKRFSEELLRWRWSGCGAREMYIYIYIGDNIKSVRI